MDKITNVSPVPGTVKQNWDYVKQLDEKINAKESLAGALSERMKLSARYRTQSIAIQHGTDALLKNRWDIDLFKGNLNKFDKLNRLAGNAASGAAAVTYEGLITHIRSGGAVNAFDWKGLLKSRGWHHVDGLTGFTEGSAKAIGKTLAMGIAKFFILLDGFKDGKISYQNSQKAGDNKFVSAFKGAFTAVKEVSKSLISWEIGSLGAAMACVFFPGLGLFGALAGGILFGGAAGFLLENYMPSPKKEKATETAQKNPFI
jgi:hypothetical protein